MVAPGENVTTQVERLYEELGWTMIGADTYDAQTWEDLRPSSATYVAGCRRRISRHLPASGDRLLDMASGPIQYAEYLEYSAHFTTRVCVDLSRRALDMAEAKIGVRGEYHHGDFLDLTIAQVDAAISLHTIYHIDQTRQEAAVRKLLAVVKPGGTVIIIYSNPHNLVSLAFAPVKAVRRLLRTGRGITTPDAIYFRPFPLGWWRRFEDVAQVSILPWRTFGAKAQKYLIPGGALGTWLLATLFRLEDRFPRFFARAGVYPMIVMRRR